MKEDQVTRLDRLEKAQQELHDKFDQMMDVMARTAKGRGVAENLDSQERHAYQNNKEDLLHPPEFTPHHAQTS